MLAHVGIDIYKLRFGLEDDFPSQRLESLGSDLLARVQLSVLVRKDAHYLDVARVFVLSSALSPAASISRWCAVPTFWLPTSGRNATANF